MGQQPDNRRVLTHRQILEGLRSLGVAPGDLLLVHSSLSSLGYVQGGAKTVVRALCDAVVSGGTVFAPTFTYAEHPYDPDRTPSLTGAVTESLRQYPTAVRSAHPTHSIAGVGADAAAILSGHDRVQPFGYGSPAWRLWEREAKVLLIGCDHRSSSMVHVAEEVVDVPYLDRTREAQVVDRNGIRHVTVRRPGCSRSFNRIDAPLRAQDLITDSCIGDARVMLMGAQPLIATVVEMLRSDPATLLCAAEQCNVCREARRMIGQSMGSS